MCPSRQTTDLLAVAAMPFDQWGSWAIYREGATAGPQRSPEHTLEMVRPSWRTASVGGPGSVPSLRDLRGF